MKITFQLLALSALFLTGCAKKDCTDGLQNHKETGVDCGGACVACMPEYQANGSWGINILNVTDGDTLTLYYDSHSFDAYLSAGTTLTVVVTEIDGDSWSFEGGAWQQSGVGTDAMAYEAVGGICDGHFSFGDFLGYSVVRLDFYENSFSITKSATVMAYY